MLDIRDNLFSKIFKFRQSKMKTPLEDYCTEIFVYILRQLVDSKNMLSIEILKLFGFKELSPNDLSQIKISTREKHYIKDQIVIPDILIYQKEKINIIEVKVNSGLRKYNVTKKKTINQIDRYKQIPKINDVFLLSKYSFFDYSIKIENKVLWSQIYSILIDSDNIIIKNFVLFLEENGMKSIIVENGAEKGMNSIFSLAELIQKSLENILAKKNYELSDEISWDYFGYYLKKSGKHESIAWVGQYREELCDYIVFELLNKNLIKKAKKIMSEENKTIETIGDGENISYIFSKMEIKKITSYSNVNKQQEVIQKWYNENIEKLL